MGNLITLQMPVGRGRRWEGWAGRRRGGNDAGDVEIKPPPPLLSIPSLRPHVAMSTTTADAGGSDILPGLRVKAAQVSRLFQQRGVTNTQRSSNLCTQSFAVKGWKGSENCLMGVVIYVVITDEEFIAGVWTG